MNIKKEARYEKYRIVQYASQTINVFVHDEYVDAGNNKSNLVSIAKILNFEYKENTNTRNLGSSLIDIIGKNNLGK